MSAFIGLIYYNPLIYASLMSNDSLIQNLFIDAYRKILFMLLIFDSLQGTLTGVIRGLGLQAQTFSICLIYWI